MTSVSEIPLVRVQPPAEPADVDDTLGPTFSRWKALEVPQPRRPSPTPLVVLALLAGVGAMLVGAAAVVSATRTADEAPAPPPAVTPKPAASTPSPSVDRRVLALLAKPSTDRAVFRGSGGRLVLAVGSAGKAVILVRGYARAPAGRPYYAWVVGPAGTARAARFTGSERAVFLSVPVGHKQRVVVAQKHPALIRPSARVVATRG